MNKQETLFKEVETKIREEKILDRYYDTIISSTEPLFTSSWETDIRELISGGMNVDEIVIEVKKMTGEIK
tara:strand:- start:4164 stop:4373 length:210 start_codon:yes stop_codon:yes gene_type:complete